MSDLERSVDRLAAESGFSGVVRVDHDGDVTFAKAYGLAHRGYGIPNTVDTRFAIASGSKSFTALVVVSLIEEGKLALDTTARSILGEDLPLIAADVTVEQLLAHRSGIGDYIDEDDADLDENDYVLSVPVHELAATEQFLRVVDGYQTKFPAGERFSYCNGGYIVLALIAERVAGTPFHDLVTERVCAPAGMAATAFLRSDELPGGVAHGYLSAHGLRTNILHLPVRGNGDGGICSTVADLHSFWHAFLAGRIASPEWVAAMVRKRPTPPSESLAYGLGFWRQRSGDGVIMIGSDAGVSFWSAHDPVTRVTYTVIANATDGAWPIARHLDGQLASAGSEAAQP